MKKLSIIILCLIYSNLFAQIPYDSIKKEIIYTDVMKVENMTSDEIFDKAKQWALSTLKSSDEMTELNDPEKSYLVGTTTIQISGYVPKSLREMSYENCFVNFKIKLDFKDNKYKYTCSNFTIFYDTRIIKFNFFESVTAPLSGFYIMVNSLEDLKKKQQEMMIFYEQALNETDQLVRALIKSMNEAIVSTEDDW
jgi:hypothetical protein